MSWLTDKASPVELGVPNVEFARHFASLMHAILTRANGKTPYHYHPWRVGDFLQGMGETSKEAICAGYLHDVVEDTVVTLQDIENLFGHNVRALVDGLTNKTHDLKDTVERHVRKRMDRERLAQMPREVKLIKLVDRIDNLSDLRGMGEDFIKMYKGESLQLLEVLRGTDEALEKELERLCGM